MAAAENESWLHRDAKPSNLAKLKTAPSKRFLYSTCVRACWSDDGSLATNRPNYAWTKQHYKWQLGLESFQISLFLCRGRKLFRIWTAVCRVAKGKYKTSRVLNCQQNVVCVPLLLLSWSVPGNTPAPSSGNLTDFELASFSKSHNGTINRCPIALASSSFVTDWPSVAF